jgi:general secretion pathway protein I
LSLSTRHSRVAGFTLIEVLVALAVVAASLAAIGSVVAINLKNTRALEERVEFTQVMRAILAGLPDGRDLEIGTQSGDRDGYHWRIDVAPFARSFVNPQSVSPWVPQSVVVRVQSPTGRILEVDTVRLRRAGG